MQTLNWREKFAGIVTLTIGLIILLLFVTDMITKRSTDITAVDGNIQISRGALFQEIRVLVAIIVSITGGWLLLKQKRFGWILSVSFLLLILLIAGYFTVLMTMLAMYGFSIFAGFVFLLVVLAIIFLSLHNTREKYRVNNAAWLSTLVFLMAIGAIFFFLQ